jgi:phosphatidylglycerophosphatase A
MTANTPPPTIRERVSLLVASLFGVGFTPKAPGTAGSIAALAILLVPTPHLLPLLCAAIIFFFVIGIVSIPSVETRYGSDPACIVIDEVVGMWLVLLSPCVPHTPLWVGAGFVLFRAFDILKPFPANWFNAKRGAVAVMMDDIVAAGYSSLVLHALWWLTLQR